MQKPAQNPPGRRLSLGDLIDWSREDTPVIRVRTESDALPGGYSAAMSPVLVNWRNSTHKDAAGFYIVRNVNTGGNPVEGVTELRTVKVPRSGVVGAEYVTVPLEPVGGIAVGAHAMIRLLFAEDRSPELLTVTGEPVRGEARVRDLVFSWEAWRPPGERFDMKKGLDPNTFGLSLRCYTGPQRFLEDAMHKRDWLCYTLRLPRHEEALVELLHVSLMMGDSLARHTIARLFDTAAGNDVMETGRAAGFTPKDYPAPQRDEWSLLKTALVENRAPEDPIADIMDGKITYQLLERSCITMALQLVGVTASRITASLPPDRQVHIDAAPRDVPAWMGELSRTGRAGFFLRIPHVLWWLVNNANVLPTKSYRILDDAGLLERDEKGPVKRGYELHGETPYGRLEDHLII